MAIWLMKRGVERSVLIFLIIAAIAIVVGIGLILAFADKFPGLIAGVFQ